MHKMREMNKQQQIVNKHWHVRLKQQCVDFKQWYVGGVTRIQWGLPGAFGFGSPAAHPLSKAFFLPKLLKYRCVLLRCTYLKHNLTRNKAGLKNKPFIYI